MTFDEIVSKVEPTEPDRKLVGRRVAEVIAAMGFVIDEASGEVAERAKPYPTPRQRHVCWY